MNAASRAGGGVRQAWRRGNERDHTCVATNDTQRAAVFSLQLRRAHQQLRDELARIREALGGDERVVTGLQVHCLAFCSALATHHRGEDDGMFTQLLDARPDLAPAIRNLTGDHAAIAAILHQIRALALLGKATAVESLPELRRELDGLAAIVESHFGYEERAISAALDHGVPDTGWSRPVFKPSEPQHPVP
jgi:Hemerythrin HHE cation binding domain